MAIENWVNLGSGNKFNKFLWHPPEGITLRRSETISKTKLKIIFLKSPSDLPGANSLNAEDAYVIHHEVPGGLHHYEGNPICKW